MKTRKLTSARLFIVFSLILIPLCGKANELYISMGMYKLRLGTEPLSFQLERDARPIARLSETQSLTFEENNVLVSAVKALSHTRFGNHVFLDVALSDGRVSELSIALAPQKVELRWTLPVAVEAENVKMAFDAADKHWFGGAVVDGHHWPLEKGNIAMSPLAAHSNQATPYWLTSTGVGYFIPTHNPLSFSLNREGNNRFEACLEKANSMTVHLFVANDMRDSYRLFAKEAGLPSSAPPKGFFEKPIFNTWMELLKDFDQQKILNYASSIRKHGFPCEVLMLDAGWAPEHGQLEFDKKKFPDPKGMIDSLHAMGFKCMLWLSPYVRETSADFPLLAEKAYCIHDPISKKPVKVKWWGGKDYHFDLSHPEAFDWLKSRLQYLQREYGVDGYKFDGGDARYIHPQFETYKNASPNRSTDYWAELGTYFPYNEYRVSWLVQSLGLVQRLRDKHVTWDKESGLGALIPHALTASMIGYGYLCPDMIGGGDAADLRNPSFKGFSQELIVRWTQASALMPMMQFSYAPWNFDEKTWEICRKYAQLHEAVSPYIYRLAQEMTHTGDPIIRPLFYDHPGDEEAIRIADQFMLGDKILVAPVVLEGATKRDVYLPDGLWKEYEGSRIFTGGQYLKEYPAPIEILPMFIKID